MVNYYISSGVTSTGVTLWNEVMYVDGTANETTVNSSGGLYVSSGGTANSTTLNSGGMYVYSGGTANSTTVAYGGMDVYSGGTANDTTVYYSGYMHVESGGTALNVVWTPCVGRVAADVGAVVTYVKTYSGVYLGAAEILLSSANGMTGTNLSGCSMYVMKGGTANSIIVNPRGYMYVYSGGTANSTTVNEYGRMYVSSGGTANSTTVKTDGSMTISSGGTANSTTVNSDGYMYVDIGGTANDTTVNASGSMTISSGGTANSTTVNASGSMTISSGGTANSTTVNSRGSMTISSGGTALNVVWTPCVGRVAADVGAVVTYVNTYSGVYLGSAETLLSSANGMTGVTLSVHSMYVMKGGTANSTTVNDWGYMYVSSGGTANSTTVNSRGSMYVYSGGTANSTTVKTDGSMTIFSGGTANETTFNDWGGLYVYSGGTANSTTVNSRGSMTISSGGTANSTTVNNYGRMYVSSGGTANSTTVDYWGYMTVFDGGTANSTTVNSRGSMTISSGGTANSTTVNSGGYMYVYSGGTANSTTVNSRGSMYVYSGGTANSTTVNASGYMYVSRYGDAYGVTISAGGRIGGFSWDEDRYFDSIKNGSAQIAELVTLVGHDMTVSSGGTANSTTINPYGSMYVYSGGTANSTTVNEYGYMTISSGGTANSTTVNEYGYMTISSGGTANSTTVNSSGSMTISSGGTANSTTVNSGGYMYVYSGGTANETTFNDWGYMYVYSGGTANSTTVNSGGYMYVYSGGTANETTFNDGGYLDVYGGVTVNSTTVNYGGWMYVYGGGTANETTVNSGGYMYVYSGGTANDTTVNASGSMYVYHGGTHRGSLQLAEGAVVSAYSGAVIDFTVAEHTADGGYLINDLSRITGTPTYTITVAEDQAAGTYKLAQGAYSFTGTISIATETAVFGRITVNGDTVAHDNFTFTLRTEEGSLNLVVSVDAGPEVLSVNPSTTAPTNQNVTVTAVFSEDTAGKQYSLDNTSWTAYTQPVVMEENGMVYFRGIDEAGNFSEVASYTVTNIDKVPPVQPTAVPFVTEPTYQNVTVGAVFSEDSTQKQYSLDGANWTAYTQPVVMTGNGMVYFRGIDAAGNVSEVTPYAVTNIDRTPPNQPAVSADITSITNRDVTLTAVFSEDSTTREFSLDGQYWQNYTQPLGIVQNWTVYFRAIDAVGNFSMTGYAVGNIDKTPPAAPTQFQNTITENQAVIDWEDVVDSGLAPLAGYEISYGNSPNLNSTGKRVGESTKTLTGLSRGVWFYRVRTLDAVGNASEWSNLQRFLILPGPGGQSDGKGSAAVTCDAQGNITVCDAGTAQNIGQLDPARWQVLDSADYDNDGVANLLVQDLSSGAVRITGNVDGGISGGVAEQGTVLGVVSDGYSVAGAGNFNGSDFPGALLVAPEQVSPGYSKVSGLACWTLDNAFNMSPGWLGAMVTTWDGDTFKMDPADLANADDATINAKYYSFELVGVGDFNGDGVDDVMIRNNMPQTAEGRTVTGSGDVFVFLTGVDISGYQAVNVAYTGRAADPWQIAGIGDFNGDEIDDVLLKNTSSGEIATWLLDSTAKYTAVGAVGTLSAGQNLAGVGDVDGDGIDDVLFTDFDGSLKAWTVQNGAYKGQLALS